MDVDDDPPFDIILPDLFDIILTNHFDVRDGYIVEGFPLAALEAATVVESFRNMGHLGFREIAKLRSDLFSNEDITIDSTQVHHSRILLSKEHNLAIISSLMGLDRSYYRQLADKVLDFAGENKIKFTLTCSIIDTDPSVETVVLGNTDEVDSMLECTGPNRAKVLESVNDEEIKIRIWTQASRSGEFTGTVTGFPAVLINQGIRKKQKVVAILTNKSSGSNDKPIKRLCCRLAQIIGIFNEREDRLGVDHRMCDHTDEYKASIKERVEQFTSNS